MTVRCYHCDEPVPDGFVATVDFQGASRNTCCMGCQAVMQAIVDADLGDYYKFRTQPAPTDAVPQALDALQIFDQPEFTDQLLTEQVHSDGSACASVTLSIDGIRCGACVWLLERTLRSVPGVVSVSVNGATHRAYLSFDPDRVALSGLLHHIESVGYRAQPLDVHQREQHVARESRRQLQRLFVAGIAMMQVMMYALPGYLSGDAQMEPAHLQLLNWASMVLTIPVVLFSAVPFFQGALRSFKVGGVGMDVPVTIGISAAFCVSVYRTLAQQGEIYFDSVSMFVFLLLLARYLEWSVRCRSLRAIDDISHQSADTAALYVDGAYRQVPAARLQPGDVIQVASGEIVPVDGRLLSDESLIDNSVLTGESQPLAVRRGDALPGGAQVAGTPVQLTVTAAQKQSTLSMVAQLVERGAAEKPPLVATADRVAHYFVWSLLIFALIVFAAWWWIDAARAATVAVTVLVVSCPCALSLATPAALAASTSRLIGLRLLITKSHVLQSTANLTDVVFDKTGTLTHGEPRVAAVEVAGNTPRTQAVALAAALEAGAAHPFAKAIQALDKTQQADTIELQALHHRAGFGISATLGGGCYVRLGSPRWCRLTDRQLQAFKPRQQRQVSSEVYLCESADRDFATSDIIARFSLADTLRDEAAHVVGAMKAHGLRVHLLSGDQTAVVADCAGQLGIETWRAATQPGDKQRYVQALQSAGACVLMVGDGVNDAPVLAAADVSVAIGNASSLAKTSADAISLASGLSILPVLLQQAWHTAAVIRQNLLWALAYNLTAIPAASFGLVSPWMAAVGMAASSLLVAINSARLWRYSAPGPLAELPPPAGEMAWNH